MAQELTKSNPIPTLRIGYALLAAGLIGLAYLLVAAAPDIKRYRRLRAM